MAWVSKSVTRLISFHMVSGVVVWFDIIFQLETISVAHEQHTITASTWRHSATPKRKTVYPTRWIRHALEHVWYAGFVLVSFGWLKSVSSSARAHLSCAVVCEMIHWVPSDWMISQHGEGWNTAGRLQTIACYEYLQSPVGLE